MRAGEILELNTFIAVAEEQRFASAAVRLGVTPSAVSQSIRRLEARLGSRLFSRTTRSVALTDAGTKLLLEVKPAFEKLARSKLVLANASVLPPGSARISVSAVAMELLILPILADFRQAHPNFRLEIVVEDRISDPVAGRYDATIRRGKLLEQDMIARGLSKSDQLVLVASDAYLTQRTKPVRPQDITNDRIVIRRPRSGAMTPWLLGRGDKIVKVKGNPTLIVDSAIAARQYARDSLGVALLARDFVAASLSEGSLRRVLPEWSKPLAGFYLMYVHRGSLHPALRHLERLITRISR